MYSTHEFGVCDGCVVQLDTNYTAVLVSDRSHLEVGTGDVNNNLDVSLAVSGFGIGVAVVDQSSFLAVSAYNATNVGFGVWADDSSTVRAPNSYISASPQAEFSIAAISSDSSIVEV